MPWRSHWVFLLPVWIGLSVDAQSLAGSKACATCHANIARQYAATPMANASGKAGASEFNRPPAGSFMSVASGTRYAVGEALEYKKTDRVGGQEVSGSKRLAYFVGSGTHARGYIFEEQGKFFQAPVAYYSARQTWDMAPGFETEKHIFLGRQIQTGCLACHASGIQLEKAVPFTEGAVGCERCHGPGSAHIAKVMSGQHDAAASIVNPATLEPAQRDGVCAQCHLTGDARITKLGKSETSFRPGDRLTDHVVPFVWSTPNQAELKVVGHFEGLWMSRCKRESGDRLWCGTCHDPHTVVPAVQKVDYFRAKCFTCHNNSSCKLNLPARAASGNDCTSCHMPKRQTFDGLHTAFTDHSIARHPVASDVEGKGQGELKPFWAGTATIRDLALAYGDVAWKTHSEQDYRRASARLEAALPEAPGDGEVLAELGYISDLSGDAVKAEQLYKRAIEAQPANVTALSNLARHMALAGKNAEAVDLWTRALSLEPGLAAPGINLARLYLSLKDAKAAQAVIARVLSLNPDSAAALELKASAEK